MSVKPIFIFSLPRSGSTLLQRMLAAHSDIETTPEPWFLIPFVYTLRGSGVYAQYSATSLHKTMKDLVKNLPNGEQDYYEGLRQFAETIYSRLSTNRAKYFLDKTPRYYLIIQEIEKIFPDAKFIFLFRNPLSTLSSIISSFYGGRLGDSWHKIDIFKGPILLAQGYKTIKDKSHVVQYEKLIIDPENVLRHVCDYLSVPYERSMAEDFSAVSLKGFGDKIGQKEYTRVDSAPLDKWKSVLGTTYRKRYALKYIEYLGVDTIKTFGYEIDKIISELNQLKTKSTSGLKDRYNIMRCHLRSFFEIPMFKKKIKEKLLLKEKFYIHF